MNNRANLTRRKFLQNSFLGLAGAVLLPGQRIEKAACRLGRVTTTAINIYEEPDFSSQAVARCKRDQLLNIYYEVKSDNNRPPWYRIWGGYVYGAYIQQVSFQINQPLSTITEGGLPAEVSVPYTRSAQLDRWGNWQPLNWLYYSSVHWVTGLQKGPDGLEWYRILDSYDRSYYADARHLRPITAQKLSPLSTNLSRNKKRIEISIAEQKLWAYEDDVLVLETLISSGVQQREELKDDEISTETPLGDFHITVKTPTRHMGASTLQAEDATGDEIPLPGVPWVSFFDESGTGLHGTYWHNNFGRRMSHGCINMRNSDALFIYRWCDPPIQPDQRQVTDWGTLVQIY